MQFVAFQLRAPAALDRTTVQMFERIFLADSDCNYFMNRYGAVRPDEPEAAVVNGEFMALPPSGASKYYIGSVNHFGGLGGFDLLIQRLDRRVRGGCFVIRYTFITVIP
jgi:hypothetical protein